MIKCFKAGKILVLSLKVIFRVLYEIGWRLPEPHIVSFHVMYEIVWRSPVLHTVSFCVLYEIIWRWRVSHTWVIYDCLTDPWQLNEKACLIFRTFESFFKKKMFNKVEIKRKFMLRTMMQLCNLEPLGFRLIRSASLLIKPCLGGALFRWTHFLIMVYDTSLADHGYVFLEGTQREKMFSESFYTPVAFLTSINSILIDFLNKISVNIQNGCFWKKRNWLARG